jgi:FKBP-type peptidyl-prolyl cis-trans isomerase
MSGRRAATLMIVATLAMAAIVAMVAMVTTLAALPALAPLVTIATASAAPSVKTPPADVAAPPADAATLVPGLWSKVLIAGHGAARPAPTDVIRVYLSEWSSSGDLVTTSFTQYAVPRYGTAQSWPEIGDGLAAMVVGEQRRFWRALPAGGYHVYDVELVAIDGAQASASPLVPPSVAAARSASGLSWLVIDAGNGTTPPDRLDEVMVVWTAVLTDDRPLPALPMTFVVRDAANRGLAEALQAMTLRERRVLWIPPSLAGGHAMVADLTLVEIRRHVTAPPDLARPPRGAKRLRSGVAYRVLARGRGPAPGAARLAADDELTIGYTAWNPRGDTLRNQPPYEDSMKGLPPGIAAGLVGAVDGERRRLWIPAAQAGDLGAGGTAVVVDAEVIAVRRMFDPLPGGLRVRFKRGLTVERGAITAPLVVDLPWSDAVRHDGVRSARLTPDGTSVDLTLTDSCMESERTLRYRLAALDARVENAAALGLHRAGRYADAALGFARAVAADPSFAKARTNLVAALARAGRRDEALAAARPLVATNPVLVEWQLLHDADWASLVGADDVAALAAPVAGAATRKTLAAGAAHSAHLGLVAAVHAEWSWGADDPEPGVAELQIFDRTGAQVVTLPATDPMIDRLLAVLGFEPGEPGRIADDTSPPRATFAAAKLGLVYGSAQARVVRGSTVLVERPRPGHEIVWATLVPGAVVTMGIDPGSEGCDGTDPTAITVLPLP